MSDPFDYGDLDGHDLELDLAPAAPARRPMASPSPADTESALLDEDLVPLDEDLLPFDAVAPASGAPYVEDGADEPFALELEDVTRPVALPSTQSMRHTAPRPIALPQPAVAPRPPPVRTLEVGLAEWVDQMSSFARGSLLALAMVSMVLFAVVVAAIAVRNATSTLAEAAQRAAEQEQAAAAAEDARYGDVDDTYDEDGDWD